MTDTLRPHPNNAPGPFYVVDGCCTACNVPFVEAPGHFAYDGKKHCFVQRQPAGKDEFNRMLRAVWAAELQCIRYRGQDAEVLRRLGELGEPHLCDVPPPSSVGRVIRSYVTFDAASTDVDSMTLEEVAIGFQSYLRLLDRHWLAYEFTPIKVEGAAAAFSLSWYEKTFHPLEFSTISLPIGRWLVRQPIEKAGSRGVSRDLDDWLKSDPRFCKIRWYSEEQWSGSKNWQETPW